MSNFPSNVIVSLSPKASPVHPGEVWRNATGTRYYLIVRQAKSGEIKALELQHAMGPTICEVDLKQLYETGKRVSYGCDVRFFK